MIINRKFRRLKEEKSNLENMLKELRSSHKSKINAIEKKVKKESKDANDEKAVATGQKEYWLKMVSRIRIIEKELKADVALTEMFVHDASLRLGRSKDHINKFKRKIEGLADHIADGARNINNEKPRSSTKM